MFSKQSSNVPYFTQLTLWHLLLIQDHSGKLALNQTFQIRQERSHFAQTSMTTNLYSISGNLYNGNKINLNSILYYKIMFSISGRPLLFNVGAQGISVPFYMYFVKHVKGCEQ